MHELLDQVVDLALENAQAQEESKALRIRTPSVTPGPVTASPRTPFAVPPAAKAAVVRQTAVLHGLLDSKAAVVRQTAALHGLPVGHGLAPRSSPTRGLQYGVAKVMPLPLRPLMPSLDDAAEDPTSDFWYLSEFGLVEELRCARDRGNGGPRSGQEAQLVAELKEVMRMAREEREGRTQEVSQSYRDWHWFEP